MLRRRIILYLVRGTALAISAPTEVQGMMRLRVASSLSNSWAKEPIEAVDSGRRCRKTLREPVSVNSRTSLRSAEMEIGKWRAETGAVKPPVQT